MAESRPTILQIIPRLDTGGAELSTIEITEAIVRAGGRALVATEGGRMADRVPQAGGELIAFPASTKNPVRLLGNVGKLRELIRAQSVNLVHARSRAPAWSALLAAHRARVPFVTTYHGAYGEQGAIKRFYNSVMVRSDRVIANSGFTADLIRQRYGTSDSKITVIHRGLDLRAFDPAAVSDDRKSALRQAWGVAGDRPIILQAARLTGWKGQRVMIAAAGKLKREGRLGNAVFVLAGDAQGRDGYSETLHRDIAENGLGACVILPGHVSDMAAAFAVAHVAVVASTEPEAFGRTATESQAMRCPVIATDIGAPRETVIARDDLPSGRTGWLVPPGDASALADSLAAALALGPLERSRMGGNARAHVAARFTVAAMQRATLAVYDDLLATDLARRFSMATD